MIFVAELFSTILKTSGKIYGTSRGLLAAASSLPTLRKDSRGRETCNRSKETSFLFLISTKEREESSFLFAGHKFPNPPREPTSISLAPLRNISRLHFPRKGVGKCEMYPYTYIRKCGVGLNSRIFPYTAWRTPKTWPSSEACGGGGGGRAKWDWARRQGGRRGTERGLRSRRLLLLLLHFSFGGVRTDASGVGSGEGARRPRRRNIV